MHSLRLARFAQKKSAFLIIVGLSVFLLVSLTTFAATSYSIGTSVRLTTDSSVRATPSGKKIGSQPNDSIGVVAGGPSYKRGTRWYNIDFQTGSDGWVRESYLTSNVVVTPTPSLSLTASATSVAYDGSTVLTWSSANTTSCTSSGAWAGPRALSGTSTILHLTTTSVFTLTCTGAGGSVSKMVTVTAAAGPSAPVPTVTLTASPTSIAYNATTVLTWSSSNATSCTASGAWSGAHALSGTGTPPRLTTTSVFTLTCTGAGGTASKSVTVTVAAAPATPTPTVSLSASPTNVAYDGSTLLTWSSTNATLCTASGAWSGPHALSGTGTVQHITTNSIFTLTCTGAGGSASRSVTVTAAAPPTATTTPPTATTTTITRTDLSTYAWSEAQKGTALNAGALTQVFGEEFEATTSLAGPRLFAPVHSSYGTGTFDKPGTAAYQFVQTPDGAGAVGALRIRAYKDAGGAWHAGNVQTADSSQTTGAIIGGGKGFACQNCYFESRMKFASSTPGAWAAFWLLSPDDKIKGHVEIDAIEWYSGDAKGHHHTVHIWPKSPLTHTQKSDYTGMAGVLNDGNWHTYGVLQTSTYIYIYMDRKEVGRIPAAPEFNQPLYMLATMAVNSKEAAAAAPPLDVYVDWMRAYTISGDPSSRGLVVEPTSHAPARVGLLAATYEALGSLYNYLLNLFN